MRLVVKLPLKHVKGKFEKSSSSKESVKKYRERAPESINSQGYIRFRLFWKYAEIGYFG